MNNIIQFPTVTEVQTQICSLPDRPAFMLASDLAEFYGTSTRRINEAVKRNPKRFPEDFCFVLTELETALLKSQNATSMMANRSLPFGFTEAGAIALSGVLKTDRAAEVSVIVNRGFVTMRNSQQQIAYDITEGLRMETMSRKPGRIRVARYAQLGWSFHKIWRKEKAAKRKIVEFISELVALGEIAEAPEGTPFNLIEEPDQLTMFADG
ncbi:MAG: ORF6N domain-containing protein [Rhizobiaceae bacterium]